MATEATKIPFVEAAAPSTPAASRVVVYAKADGLMYSKDDAGVETLMSGGSSGAVATDSIWDAKGDLAGGTGANTAAKLTVGTNGFVLTADSGETTGLKWAAASGGTAPSSARVSTSETQSGNNSWADLATAGPAVTVTVGASGVARVTLTASVGISSPNYAGMGCIMSGANTLAGDLNRCLLAGNRTADDEYSFTTLYTGLNTGSTTFTAKYNQFGSGGTATWKNREIIVETW